MNIYKFKNKNNHVSVLMICAKDVQQAKIYIANHSSLIFDEWEIDGLTPHQSPIGIKCAPPPYAYITYTNHEF